MEYPSLTEPAQHAIAEVINGDREKFEAQNISPNAVRLHMVSLGYASDLDTNGWQYDWWLNFTKGDEKWTAYGSGYYGTFGFMKTEE